MSYVAELLASSSYVITNKRLIRELGLTEAVLLGELCSEYNYWKERGGLDAGWFFSTVANVERETGIKPTSQATLLGRLQGWGLLETRKFGMPPRRHILLDFKAIASVLDGNPVQPKSERSSTEIRTEVGTESERHNNNKKSNKKNNKFSLDDVKRVCALNGLTGMSGTPERFAEWFWEVSATDGGGLNYKGKRIDSYAGLVSVLKAVNLNGKRFRAAHLEGKPYSPRADEGYL